MPFSTLIHLILTTSLRALTFSYLPQMDQGIAILSSIICPRRPSWYPAQAGPRVKALNSCSDTPSLAMLVPGSRVKSGIPPSFISIVGPGKGKDQA